MCNERSPNKIVDYTIAELLTFPAIYFGIDQEIKGLSTHEFIHYVYVRDA